MVNVTLELIWIKNLLTEIDFPQSVHETIWWQQGSNTHCRNWRISWENQTR